MMRDNTTAILQVHLDNLSRVEAGNEVQDRLRLLIEESTSRLCRLCTNTLHRKYPRLTRPPLNLHTDELLSTVVERLLKALKEVRPTTVRQYFGIASQHVRWQLNEFARSIETQTYREVFEPDRHPAVESTGSPLSDVCLRILAAIEELPIEEQEVFDLVRIQGLSVIEAAEILECSEMTIRRRLRRAISSLAIKIDSPSRLDGI